MYTEEYIRNNPDKVNWNKIYAYKKLSESFIREFQDKVDWFCISSSQKLSKQFIFEFKDKICWNSALKYQESLQNINAYL